MTAATSGVSPATLQRWVKSGRIVRVDRGIYVPADEADQDHLEVAAAILRRPEAVVVLSSALRLHGIGTRIPQVVWLAVPPGVANHRTSRPVRILRWCMIHVRQDTSIREIAGVAVPVTTPARTIVDCFRCHRQVSHEAALEALREGLAAGIRPGEIATLAEQYRVTRIRPFLEALA